jgi:hypothetical protein
MITFLMGLLIGGLLGITLVAILSIGKGEDEQLKP